MASEETKPDITLNSPVGAKPAVYKWPFTYTSKGQKIDGAEEIIETMRWVAREYQEFRPAMENLLDGLPEFKSYDCIKGLCDKYNKITDYVMKMNKGTSVSLNTSSRASQGLLKHIIQQVYNYGVVEPAELNKYSAFSSETYGETSFEFMAQMIDGDQFRPNENGTFIDLGSGVGHLVLQMAASVKCKKCYGIEIAGVPASYARLMEEKFRFWMEWHGKTYTEFELFHGDFFDERFSEIIKNSTHILVNNYAYTPEDDEKLKQIFVNLKDGTQILSSKPFYSPKTGRRITERNLSDIGSIMKVSKVQPEQKKDTVSWTTKPVPYYKHILDSSRVTRYYEKKNKRQLDGSSSDKPNKRGRSGAASDSDDASNDNIVYGPTTRAAWKLEICNSSSVNASNRTSTDSGKTTSSRNSSTDTENLYDGAIDESIVTKTKDSDSQKREKKVDVQNKSTDRSNASTQETSAQNKNGQNSSQAPKSCLDKKRDYAIKKSGTSFLQNAPPSSLYSISKPPEATNGSTSNLKIPNIVIKVKPPTESKVVNDTASSNSHRATTEPIKQEGKTIDENGKKLRQRKKSTATTKTADTSAVGTKAPSSTKSDTTAVPTKATSSSKADSKSSYSTGANSILSSATNGTRSKKAPATLKQPSKPTNVSKKKVTSPDKNLSLDLLHAKTIESVFGNVACYTNPAPGCIDHSLRSIVETPSLPKVVIKDMSMFVSSFLGQKNIEKFVNSTKQEFVQFAEKIQQPHARDVLLKNIEQEKIKNRDLHRAQEELERHIKSLNDRVPKALKAHCDELGIKNTQKSIVHHLGALLKKYQDLSAYHLQLEATLQPNQRINPPAAHSNSNLSLSSPYRAATSSATLDLSLKQTA